MSIRQLAWQCRRGQLELDLLLSHYLQTGYPYADAKEQALFIELLNWPDDCLIAALAHRIFPECLDTKRLLTKISQYTVQAQSQ